MTKRDFFIILIRVFALYSIILTVFSWIPSNLMYSFFEFESVFILAAALIFTLISILFYYLILRNTDRIINFLGIDKGFDDSKIHLSDFNSTKVLMLGIILIGGFLIVSEFSRLIEYSFIAFKNEIDTGQLYVFPTGPANQNPNVLEWILSGVNFFVGYLLLTNHTRVAKWILKKGNMS